MDNLILMKQNDIKELKEKLYIRNNKKCPLLGIDITLDKTVLDHIHKTSKENMSSTKGSIRDAIEFRANAMEGKITNNWKRYFGADEDSHPISLPDYLRNLANYLEKGAYEEDGKYYIHPNETPRNPKISKRQYNKLKKVYERSMMKKKFPEFPKSGKLSKPLEELFSKFNISYTI